jgi:hypothetical protein
MFRKPVSKKLSSSMRMIGRAFLVVAPSDQPAIRGQADASRLAAGVAERGRSGSSLCRCCLRHHNPAPGIQEAPFRVVPGEVRRGAVFARATA